jgi:hypothetical protein
LKENQEEIASVIPALKLSLSSFAEHLHELWMKEKKKNGKEKAGTD